MDEGIYIAQIVAQTGLWLLERNYCLNNELLCHPSTGNSPKVFHPMMAVQHLLRKGVKRIIGFFHLFV